MAIAFVDVDTQVDFIEPSGKLYAKGAEAVKPQLARLIEVARARKIPLVSSVDSHAPNDPEFGKYPPHCLAGTRTFCALLAVGQWPLAQIEFGLYLVRSDCMKQRLRCDAVAARSFDAQ